MSITSDIQKLEPGELVWLYELDAASLGGPVLRFHPYNVGPLAFQGRTYEPWPVTARDFERTGEGQQPSPTLQVGNIGVNAATGEPVVGVISSLCLALQDLAGAKVTVRRTFAKYLDGEPTADPAQELPPEIYIVEQRIDEGPDSVTFELSGALTFDGLRLPGRPIQTTCAWLFKGGYRGPYCGYTGAAYFTDQDEPTSDPARDKCGGRVQSCRLRFAAQQGVTPVAAVINFGGFPAADRLR